MTLRLLTLVSLLALVMSSCAAPASVQGGFVVVEVDGLTISPDPAIAVDIEGGWLYGTGPVNQWQATLQGGRVGRVVSSRMAGPPGLMELESALLAALDGAKVRADGEGGVEAVKDSRVVVRLAAR